jgi:hypothetical protein
LAEATSSLQAQTGVVPEMKREIGFLDLTLFYVVSGLSLRWIATAAASGPSSIAVWIFALGRLLSAARRLRAGTIFALSAGGRPLCVGARGIRRLCRLYLRVDLLDEQPAILLRHALFRGGSALFAGGSRGAALANESSYFMTFSLVALGGITLLNMIGVKPSKWLNNAGAVGMSLPVVMLIVLGVLSWMRRAGYAFYLACDDASCEREERHLLVDDLLCVRWRGVRLVHGRRDQEHSPHRAPRVVFAGVLITLGYILGTHGHAGRHAQRADRRAAAAS